MCEQDNTVTWEREERVGVRREKGNAGGTGRMRDRERERIARRREA